MELNKKPTAEIQIELSEIAGGIAAKVIRASQLLSELQRRKIFHPFMRTSILRHHRGISDGKLSAMAVLTLGGNMPLISAIKALSIEMQERLASGVAVDVAEMTPEGKVITVSRPIIELSGSALERVFGSKGVRSLTEQAKLLGKEPDRKKVNGIMVDKDEIALIFGRMHVRPNDLIAPLKALGYDLKKKPVASTH